MSNRQRNPTQKSYEATPEGIVIKDKRQMTNGPITPNYVIDLYLPIIGFAGLGVLTALYRVAINDVRAVAVLTEFAHAGRVGFRALDSILSLLDDLKIIRVNKPKGPSRGKHSKTEIELLDAPITIPSRYAETVLERTLTRWMIEGTSCQATIGELSGNNWRVVRQQLADSQATIGELLPDNSMYKEDVPMHDVPMHDVPTHMGSAPVARVSESTLPAGEAGLKGPSRHPFDTILKWAGQQPGINSALALATSRHHDGLADSQIDDWLARQPSGGHAASGQGTAADSLPGERDDGLLERFLGCIESRINADSFAAWFKPITLLSRDGQSVLLAVPDRTARDWISSNYFDVIEEALAELGLGGYKIDFRFPV